MSTEKEPTEDRVKRLVADHLGKKPEEIDAAADIVETYEADSLDRVEIVMRVEDEFGIEIPDEDAEPFRSTADIAAYVAKRIA